ncbi:MULTISPECIES: MFS transporter [unclassified Paenibacillus]|uniref:MFS transporter n=1 Tax=unclassified Paenibacillus TaxID=185978 RepID=UPI0004F678AE|nr:MFS transporter [Paenibacillus sp. FSL R5-0345]AIQ34081.1 MFS transporter [Paenibacillus sp. FSL R5-0345]
MPEQLELRTKLWTKSFIALTISALFLFMNLQMLLSSFPSYVKSEFQAGDIMVSLVTSVFALTAIASRFMTAFLMRRVSRNVLLYIGLAIAAAITGLYVVADSIGSLLLMRVGYGIGFGIASTIIPTIVSQIIPSKRMGEGIGYFGLSTSLAMSIGPMIGLNVMKQSGFGTLAMMGTFTLLLAFPVLFFSRSLPAVPKKQPIERSIAPSKPLKVPFNTKLVLPAILNVLIAITYGGLLSFIALFGESVHLEQVGLFFLFNAITIIIIRPISGRLFDKKGPAAVLIPAAVCVVASLTVLSYTTSMPMLIVSALLYGLGFGAIQPTIQAWMLRTSTPAQYGMANSMFYNSTDLGVASGAIILGAISAASDYGMMYRYSAGFMVLFLMIYIGIQITKARNNPSTLSQ